MNLLGAKKIVLVTPWKDDINRAIIKFMEDSGFQIGSFKTANAPFETFPEMPPSIPYDLALSLIPFLFKQGAALERRQISQHHSDPYS